MSAVTQVVPQLEDLPAVHQALEERFTRYVRIDTTSDENVSSAPSTAKQFNLLNLLKQELEAMGAEEILLTDEGCLYATVPATAAHDTPTIGLCAHTDTSPAFSGENVKPIVHRQYDGQPIVLPDDPSQIIDPAEFPYLATKKGEDIVTASGTTLLGADDKAGVAIIMTVADHLLQNRDIPHGRIRLLFTPDEEIGRGVDNVDLATFGADVCYTLDGGELGEIESETFSADKATIDITGISTHPGQAKGVMVNALNLAAKFVQALPQNERTPETTDGRNGFIHLYEINGTAAQAQLRFILRAFEMDELEAHTTILQKVCDDLRHSEPRAKIQLTINPQYRNMRYWLEKDQTPVDLARQAAHQLGITPIETPIRGGTDGSRLTEMGVPTPNIFTGMQNFHGPLEWVSLQDMGQSVAFCLALLRLWAEKPSA